MADAAIAMTERMIDPAVANARRRRWAVFAGRALLIVAVLGVWQLASPKLDPVIFSSPLQIAQRLGEWLANGTLWKNLLVTGEEVALGYVIGAAAGVVLGLVLGSYPVLAEILDPVLMAIYGVPKIAFGPLFVVWFGINITPKLVITAIMVFFFMFFSTYDGVRRVDKSLINSIRLMGATPLQERLLVTIPGSLPSIFLGLKLAVPEALVGAIVGELIVSNHGVGYLIQFAATQLDSAGVFAGLFVLMLLALVANSIVKLASEKKGTYE